MSKLSPAQETLLDEIREAGILYIRRYSRYGRTVAVLRRKGLVEVVERDLSGMAMDGWSVVGAAPQ